MPDYRRYRMDGGTYFFTLKTEHNAPLFADTQYATILGTVFRATVERWPFTIDALVLLPDHLHAIWSLPSGDADYSTRWAWLKKEFTHRFIATGGIEQPKSRSRKRNRRRGVWQRRFWEHTIEDEDDFIAHFDYVHWNPVKHGYARSPSEWPHSTFHRWVRDGVYASNWGRSHAPPTVQHVRNAGE